MARRMRHLRAAMGNDNCRQFAARLGLSYHRWHNYESGYPVTLEAALVMVEAIPGLTLDWIFRGTLEPMPDQLRAKLAARSRSN